MSVWKTIFPSIFFFKLGIGDESTAFFSICLQTKRTLLLYLHKLEVKYDQIINISTKQYLDLTDLQIHFFRKLKL